MRCISQFGNKPVLSRASRRRIVSCYEWMESLIFSLVFGTFAFVLLFRIVSVSGSSMVPNLLSSDRVLLYSLFYTPKRGDVVVITHSAKLDEPIIKRVIATEKQIVDIDFNKGIVYVDGKPVDESTYIKNGITIQPSDFTYPLTVPPGHIFVLGDNRSVSNDSRSADVGMVDERYIMGKAIFIVFPADRIGIVKK